MKPHDMTVPTNCLTDAEVTGFLRHELASSRLLECAEHIGECDTCRDKLASRQDLAAAMLQVQRALNPFVEHVHEDELQEYISGQLSLARIREIDGHLTKCAQCVEEVRDLRNFA